MLIEKKNVTELLPADYNPRKDLKPGDAEYEKLKRSIEQFGYVEPVIWNATTGCVVGGHQRLKVLQDMGMTEVDCVVVELDIEHEKALNVALNKISGEWDNDKLALLIADLQGADFDVSLTALSLLNLMIYSRTLPRIKSKTTILMLRQNFRSLHFLKPATSGVLDSIAFIVETAQSQKVMNY